MPNSSWKVGRNHRLPFFLCLAACRTRSRAYDTRSRPCVRCVLCSLAFLLVPALGPTGSAASAIVADALFVGFPATMAECDFSRSFIIGYGSSLPGAGQSSTRDFPVGQPRDLPVPAQRASAHAKVCDHAGSSGRSRWRGFHRPKSVGTRDEVIFAVQSLGLCAPLSTLRRDPHGQLRMTRGRCGSLLLQS